MYRLFSSVAVVLFMTASVLLADRLGGAIRKKLSVTGPGPTWAVALSLAVVFSGVITFKAREVVPQAPFAALLVSALIWVFVQLGIVIMTSYYFPLSELVHRFRDRKLSKFDKDLKRQERAAQRWATE